MTITQGKPCIFCDIIDGREPAQTVRTWRDAIAIVPLEPVTPGHLLVIPRAHRTDWAEDAAVTGLAASRAAELAQELDVYPANLITSAGHAATQSVWHLHWHIVPRSEKDGLALPWHSGC